MSKKKRSNSYYLKLLKNNPIQLKRYKSMMKAQGFFFKEVPKIEKDFVFKEYEMEKM